MPVLQAAVDGLVIVLSWPNVLYPIAGTLLAMAFSLLPGVSAVTLMAIAIPLTMDWDPLHVLLFFGPLVGGATFMGSITAILVNMPGTAPNVATMIDGHALARKGEAKTAIACSATASALGSSVGILLLLLLIPAMRPIILAVGPAELLMLAVWGLTTIVVVVRDSVVKGLALAGVGLLLAFIGFDPRTAESRYAFGSLYLRDGLSLVPVFIGIFAVAEVIDLIVSRRATISGRTRVAELSGSVREGVLSVYRHFGLFIKSSIIGTIVGMVPGIGGTVAAFAAYGQAAQSVRDGGDFGHGDIRGVLAPEAANDAKDGGSLLPTLAFGVPGSVGTALLLTALITHGVTPGAELMNDNLDLVFVLIWSLFFANWMTSILGLALINQLTLLTVIRVQLLAPAILLLAAASALAYRARIEDVIVVFLFGVIGYYMKKYGWPRIALVMALVLGPVFEVNFHLTRTLHELGRINFWTRPIAMTLLALTLVFSLAPLLARRRRRVEEQ